MTQLLLSPKILVAAEIDGIEMGVLADGTPYLTIRGLAKACGLAPSTVIEQVQAWASGKRTSKLARTIAAAGYEGDRLSIELSSNFHAVPDSICVLVLEHYAFDQQNATAARNYRVLARHGLRTYIYNSTGYSPAVVLPRGLRDFYDRLLLNKLPVGHFGVFREMSEFLLRAIQAGLVIDAQTIPDLSVGKSWANHWEKIGGDSVYGPRVHFEHNYPDYYPQSESNPQEAWAYPVAALGVFREWLDAEYIPTKFPAYLKGKVKRRVLDEQAAARLIAAVTPEQLPAASGD